MRTKLLLWAVGAVLSAAACKGETVVKPDPQTQTELDNCVANQKANKTLIATLQEENAKLQTRQAEAVQVTVVIEGDALTIKPGKPGEVRPIDDKIVTASTNEFLALVRRSRGAIQKCYEQELKKSTGLQSRTTTLTISASFLATGAYQSARFAPSLSDTFDNCMRAIAANWKLSQPPPVQSFQTQVSLTPS